MDKRSSKNGTKPECNDIQAEIDKFLAETKTLFEIHGEPEIVPSEFDIFCSEMDNKINLLENKLHRTSNQYKRLEISGQITLCFALRHKRMNDEVEKALRKLQS